MQAIDSSLRTRISRLLFQLPVHIHRINNNNRGEPRVFPASRETAVFTPCFTPDRRELVRDR
ncbi:hypothetical protein EYF80_025481 [Liparis tanakae]|uniref:Uncharacterized protein n=1 Tax=Liparis tanakae TaxID=230148 RepID=A0A4Z2HFI1_9TELE|nr:hypothetical protein EYF80_025481 [Liparis tanakae]